MTFRRWNGPEFISDAVRDWIKAVGAKTAYIEPGSLRESGYCESFNGRMRGELQKSEISYSLREAQISIKSWRNHDNTKRPIVLRAVAHLRLRPIMHQLSNWATQVGLLRGLKVALFTDGAWLRLPPRTGVRVWVEDEGLLLVCDGSGWVGTTPDTLQYLTLLGLGTTADAANPFSSKLNAALWTAKAVAKGGNGDLFYNMNKEAAGDETSGSRSRPIS